MCSTSEQRIAQIGRAIDDLAAEAKRASAKSEHPRMTDGVPEPVTAVSANDADRMVMRVAELWALLAELDPEVARRLPTYEA